MANNINNTIQLIRESLLESDELTAIVSSRVFSSHIVDYENSTVPFPLVIIERIGGDARYANSMQTVRFYIYCYSKTSTDEAMTIYNIVYNNLHGAKLDIDSVTPKGYAIETNRPVEDYNIVCKGWFAKGTFLCYTA